MSSPQIQKITNVDNSFTKRGNTLTVAFGRAVDAQ